MVLGDGVASPSTPARGYGKAMKLKVFQQGPVFLPVQSLIRGVHGPGRLQAGPGNSLSKMGQAEMSRPVSSAMSYQSTNPHGT